MFDVGFWELGLIAVVALLVLGPERLPRAARTVGLWLGRARRVVMNVKTEIDREIKAEELKQIMAKQAQSSGVHEIVEQTREAVEGASRPGSKPQAESGRPPPDAAESKQSDEPKP
jgi:sec-independent protein translocase protein TatB